MFKKLVLVALTVGIFQNLMAEANPVGKIECTVLQGSDLNSQMFGLNNPPQVGDKTVINAQAAAITELTFTNESSIPLSTLGAKLMLQPKGREALIHYEGVASSRTSHYTGILAIQGAGDVVYANLQVLRKPFTGFTFPLMELYKLTMECKRLPQ